MIHIQPPSGLFQSFAYPKISCLEKCDLHYFMSINWCIHHSEQTHIDKLILLVTWINFIISPWKSWFQSVYLSCFNYLNSSFLQKTGQTGATLVVARDWVIDVMMMMMMQTPVESLVLDPNIYQIIPSSNPSRGRYPFLHYISRNEDIAFQVSYWC